MHLYAEIMVSYTLRISALKEKRMSGKRVERVDYDGL